VKNKSAHPFKQGGNSQHTGVSLSLGWMQVLEKKKSMKDFFIHSHPRFSRFLAVFFMWSDVDWYCLVFNSVADFCMDEKGKE